MASPAKTALEGVRVLDLGRYQAGPRCTLMLARMGAEVIKVEATEGDESRSGGPKVRGQSAYWVQYNSGKKSLAMDLRAEKGKRLLRELVQVSDVLLENFRPGTLEKMGFGYDALKALNPGIVLVRVSAYGQYGPYSERIGYDPIGQALGGLMWLTGFPDDPPTKTHFPLIDRITALHATIGALAALWERERSGQGQVIDVSLADTGFTVNEIPISAFLGDGTVERREGNGRGLMNAYRSADGWVYIAAVSDRIWPRVCKALDWGGRKDDPRFANRAAREANAQLLEGELSAWFGARSTKDAVAHLSEFGVPASPVNDVEAAAMDPHVHEREVMVEVPDPVAGKIHVTGKTIKFDRTPMVVGSAPTVGQHTAEILSGILGYSEAEIQALADEKVVYCGE